MGTSAADLIGEEWFLDIVEADVRGQADPERAKWLRSSEVVEAWRAALVAKKAQLDNQATHRKAIVSEARRPGQVTREEEDYHRWRKGVTKYRTALERKLIESKVFLNEIQRRQRDLEDVAIVLDELPKDWTLDEIRDAIIELRGRPA